MLENTIVILAVDVIVIALMICIVIILRRVDRNAKSAMKKIDAVMSKLIGNGK